MKNHTISIRLNKEMKEKLDYILSKEDCSKSKIITSMIYNYRTDDVTTEENKKKALQHFIRIIELANSIDNELGYEIQREVDKIQCLIL